MNVSTSRSPAPALAALCVLATLANTSPVNAGHESASDASSAAEPPGTRNRDETTTALENLALQYSAPPDCPDRKAFLRQITERGRLSSAAFKDTRELVVDVRQTVGGFVGTFHIRSRHGVSGDRQVDHHDCQEVVEALAVVTVIALEQQSNSTTRRPPSHANQEPRAPAPQKQEPPQQFRHSLADDQRWPREAQRHQLTSVEAGNLSLDVHSAVNLQAGVGLGILPGQLLPRYDLTIGSALFLTLPGGRQGLVGMVPRLRLSLLGSGTKRTDDAKTGALGAGFAMGACLTPHYDSSGWVLLGCVEYGGTAMQFDTSEPGAKTVEQTWGSGKVAATLDAEYNVNSWFQLAARLGWEGHVQGDQPIVNAAGDELFSVSGSTIFATLGLGIHF